MTSSDMLSINNVAAKLGLSVHQLRRWELMFGLEIKRGRGQQRQYREEDMSVLERIKELVEQGWPTSQIRPQLEAEGLLTPKLIGAPPAPGNPEVLQEAIIGLRNFSERRFIDLSKQIDELRQLLISVTLKQELSADRSSPWQPVASEYVPAPKTMPAQEITIGPQISIDPPKAPPVQPPRVNQIPPPGTPASAPLPYGSQAASPSASASEFSQRSMIIGGSPSPSAESKPATESVEEAAKPITDALQRSMSTLDSLFKDQRNTPGLGASDSTTSASQTTSTTSSSSLPSSGSTPPVRYSTIPPTAPFPGASPQDPASSTGTSSTSGAPQTTSTTSASQTPAVSPATSSGFGSNPNNPAISTSGSTSSSSIPAAPYGSPRPTAPGFPGTGSQTNASAAPPEGTAGASSPSSSPSTGWDQAFTKTSVDVEAVPQSGLFDSSSPAPAASPSATGAQASPASGFGSEKNPFTTTGTSTSSVDGKPVDSSGPALMGQTMPSGQGFSGMPPGQNLTGPLPAHAPIESFAPEQKEKLVASQSDSTSTDLPRSQEPEVEAEPEPPPPVPALPVTAGPQVNFGPNVSAPTPQVTPQRVDDNFGLGEVTDQNYLTVLGRALDLIGWSDEQADSFSLKTFGVPHWDELGRSQAEKLVAHLVGLLKDQLAQ